VLLAFGNVEGFLEWTTAFEAWHQARWKGRKDEK
jgi:hypothetical protein